MVGTELEDADDGGRGAEVAGADVVGGDVPPGADVVGEVVGTPAGGNVVGVKTAPGDVTGADEGVVVVGASLPPEELQAVSRTASMQPALAARRVRCNSPGCLGRP